MGLDLESAVIHSRHTIVDLKAQFATIREKYCPPSRHLESCCSSATQ
jgi:hypothetical protein